MPDRLWDVTGVEEKRSTVCLIGRGGEEGAEGGGGTEAVAEGQGREAEK